MGNRWIRQRNGTTCGPIAIMNLLKWLGRPITYHKDYKYYKKKCRCKEYGTELSDFVSVLYGIEGIKISPRTVPNIGVIDEAISQGRAVVMKSALIEGGEILGHYFIVTERTDKSFFCVNVNNKHSWISKPAFRNQYLQHHAHYCYLCGIAPYCWIIRAE